MVGAERFSHRRQCLSATNTTICANLQLVYIKEHVSSSNIYIVNNNYPLTKFGSSCIICSNNIYLYYIYRFTVCRFITIESTKCRFFQLSLDSPTQNYEQ